MDSAGDDPCGPGFPIRTSADQRLLASPRGFSQRATSFIASMRQGIHRMPFETLDQQPISARFDSAARRPAPSPISPMPPSEPRNPAIPPDTLPRRTRVTRGPPAAGRSPASIAASRLSTMSNTRRDPAARPPSRGADTRRTARHRPWERPEAPPPIFGLPVLPVCPGRRAPVVAPRSSRPGRRAPVVAPRSSRPGRRARRSGPARSLVEADGIEPTTSCLQSTRSPN